MADTVKRWAPRNFLWRIAEDKGRTPILWNENQGLVLTINTVRPDLYMESIGCRLIVQGWVVFIEASQKMQTISDNGQTSVTMTLKNLHKATSVDEMAWSCGK